MSPSPERSALPVRRSAPSVRRERLSQTQCRNGCEIKKKCELVAAKRIENLIYTRPVLRCNAPASNSLRMALRHCTPDQQQLRYSAPGQQQLPDGAQPRRPGQQKLRYGSTPATTPLRRPCQQQLRYGALASNKPHPAEKSTPVWLAIWRTWAGFANSQHRDAAFATPDNICAHSSLLPH